MMCRENGRLSMPLASAFLTHGFTCFRFGEDKGFQKRIYLIYDGIHYDALVYNLAPQSASRDFDLTLFNPADLTVEKQCNALVDKEFKVNTFRSPPSFVVTCHSLGGQVCGRVQLHASVRHLQEEHASFSLFHAQPA